MGLLNTIQTKTMEARTREKIKPLLESRMMRDILLEIQQRGTELLDLQSVPLEQRDRASRMEAENGRDRLKQSVIGEVILDEAGIILFAKDEEIAFLYADYNYENISDTDYLPAVAQYLVQHLRGYYNISCTFSAVTKSNGKVTEKTRQVFVKRHHEDTPFNPQPIKRQKLF